MRRIRALIWSVAVLAGAVAALPAVADPAAIAGAPANQPLGVRAASLTQDGQQLVWRVVLDDPFAPAALARDRRSLCLVIERAANGTVAGVLCVAPTRSGRHARVVYMRVTAQGRGPARVVSAILSRSSPENLTVRFLPSSAGVAYAPLRWQVLSAVAAPACVPAAPSAAGCTAWFPTKPALAKLHTPQVIGCVPSGPGYVSQGPTDRRLIALTFDDGPWPDTPQFLSVLEREHVVATFFEIGDQIATYGEGGAVERRMLADGDMIGDHTWSHPDVAGAGSFAREQISDAAAAIHRATGGFTPCLFRAPYGDVSPALISEARGLGFTTIQWDVDPRDWATPGVGAIYQNVIANAHNGAIVIQHDGGGNRSETIAALPMEIDTLRREGYQFVTVTQLLGQTLIYK